MAERKQQANPQQNNPQTERDTSSTPPHGDTLNESTESTRHGRTSERREGQNTNQETDTTGNNTNEETGRSGSRTSQENI